MPFDYLWFRMIFDMNFSLVWKVQFPSILFIFHPNMSSLTLMPIKKCFFLEGFNNLKRVLVYFLCVTIESMDPMQVTICNSSVQSTLLGIKKLSNFNSWSKIDLKILNSKWVLKNQKNGNLNTQIERYFVI